LSFVNSSLFSTISPHQGRQQYTPPITIHCFSPLGNTFFNKINSTYQKSAHISNTLFNSSSVSKPSTKSFYSTRSIKNKHSAKKDSSLNLYIYKLPTLSIKNHQLPTIQSSRTCLSQDLQLHLFIHLDPPKTITCQKKLSIKIVNFKHITSTIDQKSPLTSNTLFNSSSLSKPSTTSFYSSRSTKNKHLPKETLYQNCLFQTHCQRYRSRIITLQQRTRP